MRYFRIPDLVPGWGCKAGVAAISIAGDGRAAQPAVETMLPKIPKVRDHECLSTSYDGMGWEEMMAVVYGTYRITCILRYGSLQM